MFRRTQLTGGGNENIARAAKGQPKKGAANGDAKGLELRHRLELVDDKVLASLRPVSQETQGPPSPTAAVYNDGATVDDRMVAVKLLKPTLDGSTHVHLLPDPAWDVDYAHDQVPADGKPDGAIHWCVRVTWQEGKQERFAQVSEAEWREVGGRFDPQPVKALTADEVVALGSRGVPETIPYEDIRWYEPLEGMPPWMPDPAECLERCTIGATYAQVKYNNYATLNCMNADHWSLKLEAGLGPFKEKLQATLDESDAELEALIAALSTSIASGGDKALVFARAVGQLVLANDEFEPQRPVPDYARFNRYPPFLIDLADKLGIHLNPKQQSWERKPDRGRALAKLLELPVKDQRQAVSALLVWSNASNPIPEPLESPHELPDDDPDHVPAWVFDSSLALLSPAHRSVHVVVEGETDCGTTLDDKSVAVDEVGDYSPCGRCTWED